MRLYHIHIRKTAGTTILSLLNSLFNKERICPIRSEIELNTRIKFGERLKYLQNFDLISGHYYNYGKRLDETHKSIVFVRDPLKRTISAYNQIMSDENDIYRKFIIDKKMQDALLDINCAREFRNAQCRQLVNNAGYEYDSISAMERIAIACTFLKNVWFLGIQDMFEVSYNLLKSKLKLEINNIKESPKINTKITASGIKIKDIESDVLRTIYEINREDLLIYEFALKEFDSTLINYIWGEAHH